MTLRMSPEHGKVYTMAVISWFWFVSVFYHSQGEGEKFLMQKEILFSQRHFETFVYEVHQSIFVHCTFEVCYQEMYFPWKEIGKGPRRALLTVTKCVFESTFHIFTLCFFPLLLQLAFFHQSYFGWYWKFSLGPLWTVQRAFRELTKLSICCKTFCFCVLLYTT